MSVSRILKSKEAAAFDWRDIYESRQTNKVLTAEVSAVENHDNNFCFAIFYGDAKIIIPQEISGGSEQEEPERQRRIMYAMVGATIDFVVVDIDKENNLAIASRKKAMEIKQKDLVKLSAGQKVACRIVAVGRTLAIAETYGVVTRLLPKDLSWGFMADVRDYVSVGDELDAIVKKVDIENKKLDISVRDAMHDPYLNIDKKYKQDSDCMATVSFIPEYGVFVNLEPGIDALCPHPGWTNLKLNVGDKVSIKLKSIDPEKRKIRALITRLIKRA